MKNKSVFKLLTTGFLVSFFMASNASAEETRWLNPYKFIGGENTILTTSSDNPGSITVLPVANSETHDISKRFEIKQGYELTSVKVCLRNDLTNLATSPLFGIEIFKLASPQDNGNGLDVAPDELLYPVSPTTAQASEECSLLPIDPPIQSTDEINLLSIYFDSAVEYAPAIVSAAGLGETPLHVTIDGCNSGVFDEVEDNDGNLLIDVIDECAVNAKNHGKYVSCVTKAANVFKKQKHITGKQKGKLTKCAAQANIPN